MRNAHHVGMADIVVLKSPARFVILGLGSCVSLVIYDPEADVAGMAHVMLPTAAGKTTGKAGKFADTAVTALVEQMLQNGASKDKMKAKLAGGAQMFSSEHGGGSFELLNIGARNVQMCREKLAEQGISIVASEVGGYKGRTVNFSTDSWTLTVRTLGEKESVDL